MKNKPLLWSLMIYALGIIASYQLDFHHPFIPKGICLLIGIIGLSLFLSLFRWSCFRKKHPKMLKILLILLAFSIFLFGFFYTAQNHPKWLEKDPHHLLHFLKSPLPCTITGALYMPKRSLTHKEKIYIELETIRIHKDQNVSPIKGRVIINLYNIKMDLACGDRISVTTKLRPPVGFRNEKTFNYQRYLQRQGIFAIGSVNKADKIRKLSPPKNQNGVTGKVFHLRKQAGHLAKTALKEEETAALFKALILGDRDEVTDKTKKAFQRTGTAHFLAVSGLHLGMVLLFCLILIQVMKKIIPLSWMEKISRIAPYTRTISLLSIIPLFFYTLLTGMRTSTLRAFIMILLYLAAFFFDRLKDYYSTLAWAALFILIWRPLSLFEIDFQFTFLATWGVIFYLHHRPHLFSEHPWLRKGSDLVLISASVVFITAPLSILYFHYVSPAGILLTPLIIPLLSLIIPMGLIATILIPLSQWLSGLLILVCGAGIHIFIKGLQWLGAFPWIFFPLPSPPLWRILLFYVILGLVLWWFSRQRSGIAFYCSIFLLILAFLFLNGPFFQGIFHRDIMEMTFMDVGKGDAALIRCPSGQNILIDGGGSYDRSFDIGETVLTPYLWSNGIKRIHAVAVSHPHPDHIYGLFAILKNFPVEEVWVTYSTLEDKRYEELAMIMDQYGIRERLLHSGDTISLAQGVEAICLHPLKSGKISSPRGKNSLINNHSMVLKIQYGHISVLFTGDIEKEAERYLIQNAMKKHLPSTILKAPHHGSKNSNSMRFLNAVRPEATIISTRQSSWYPLPAPSALKRLETLQAQIYRTDLHGAITLSTDGNSYRIHTWMDHQTALPILRWF